MTSAFRNPILRIASLALGSAALAVMSGCGAGNLASPVSNTSMSISGIIHGGPNPIKGAQVTLWETVTAGVPHAGHGTAGTSSYGSAAQVLSQTTSDGYGAFSFNGGPAYTCDAGEYAYITGTGGLTGSNAPNPNSVQVVALGDCSKIGSSTQVFLSELTTVAAAYALGSFIGEDSTKLGSGVQNVWIGAPANNNAAAPGCTGSGASMKCTAGGLGHAFDNAISLVDAVRYTSGNPLGTANTTPMKDGVNINTSGVIPQALLNTVGNVLQSCVNSIGGFANDGSACGKLFGETTVGSSTPTDTLQAAISIAKHPANNVSQIAQLAQPISFFTPQLSVPPTDFSLAVTFDGINGTQFGKPQYLTLDYADNVYTLALPGTTTSNLAGLAPNGEGLFIGSSSTTYYNQNFLATDTAGNLWSANASTTAPAVLLYDTAAGTLDQVITPADPGDFVKPNGVAVDQFNDLYFNQAGAGTTVWYIPYTSITPIETTLDGGTGATIPGPGNPSNMVMDANQDVWMSMGGANNVKLFYELVPTLGSGKSEVVCTEPDFCGLNTYPGGTSTTYGPTYGTVFDSGGHSWTNTGTAAYELSFNQANDIFTLTNTVTLTTGDVLEYPAIDGGNTIFYPDNTSGGLVAYSTTGGAAVQLAPCYAANGAKKCAANPAMKAPVNAQVDSTGAVWFSDPISGRLVQVLGVGAPTWPQLSFAHFGVTPQ